MRKTMAPQGSQSSRHLLAGFRQALRWIAALLFALPLLASAAVDSANGIAISVAPGNWGTAQLGDIQQVLESVADELRGQVSYPRETRLNIRVMPRTGSPRVLYQRGPNGEYRVHLTARNERWFQYAYQFSHELCHIFSNFDHKEIKDNEAVTDHQWFEETLCEMASLSTLKHLARTWAKTPPAGKWAAYAPTFARYADHLLAEEHRRLPAGQSLSQWYREHGMALRESPYQREKNELAASALLPLFDKEPGNWQAIIYLNPDQAGHLKGFDDYLTAWHAACPSGQKELIRQTMALFGLTPASAEPPKLLSLLNTGTD